MTPIHIRKGRLEDWPVIAAANSALAAETEGKHLPPETLELGVRAALLDEHKAQYFVAVIDDRVVGQVMHTREWSDWRNGEIWWLQSVFVAPAHRGCGVFRALYEHVYALAAADNDVVGLRLYVERENDRAQQTYHKLGMRMPGYHVMEALFEAEESAPQ
ncbi:putative acetyltransferase [Symmachiella dynata]|uniref:GNAT family N-acetyltransferase n=1 Tax=Symmachiella dynata TaxID=2527995 RepID=UPI00118A7C36|nr:GNAT family N-acetyltransferase [Symmachiella dynata]QDT46549.1 putative acetyltransferase [Symmachiella dynata]